MEYYLMVKNGCIILPHSWRRPYVFLLSSVNIKKLLLACAISLITSTAGFAAQSEIWQPSRKADDGCVWQPYTNEKKGIKLGYQNCTDPSAHYVLSWKNNVLEQHRPANDVTFNGPTILELYKKTPERSIEQAMVDKFISKLKKIERTNCHVIKDDTIPSRPGVEHYRIVPTASYEKKVIDAFNKENPEGGVPYETICGEHGQWAEGDAYFEYHPIEAADKFIYVIVGQDEPLFDENSIVIDK